MALPIGNLVTAGIRNQSTAGFWPSSMSGSYYTSTRNIFVGSLCALGIFLIAYRFDRSDDRWSTAAGCCALVVALFPTAPHDNPSVGQVTISAFHQAGAVALLFSMAVFCLCSFKDPQFARSSWARNIYLWGGRLILAFIVVAFVVPRTHVGDHWPITPLYYGEWGAVWSFGFAWTAAALELAGDIGRMGRIRRALNRLSGWLGRFVSFGGNRTGVQPASSHRL